MFWFLETGSHYADQDGHRPTEIYYFHDPQEIVTELWACGRVRASHEKARALVSKVSVPGLKNKGAKIKNETNMIQYWEIRDSFLGH